MQDVHSITATTAPDSKTLLTPEDCAALLSVPVQTLAAWRHNRRVPLRWIKVGRLVRYRMADILAFLAANSQGVAA